MQKTLRASALLAVVFVAFLSWNREKPRPTGPIAPLGSAASATSNPTFLSTSSPAPTSPIASPTVSEAIASFESWSDQFLGSAPSNRANLLASGMEIATQRRTAMRHLIMHAPKSALDHAVPDDMRRQLPSQIQDLLEERVSGKGFFGVAIVDYPDQQRREVRREISMSGRKFEAFVYGRRNSQTTREQETFWGIALDGKLALHEAPIRALTVAESAGLPINQNCPVSGLNGNTYQKPALGEIAGRVEVFCGAGHLAAMNRRLAADGGIATDGEEPPVAHDGWTQGPRSVLFMRVTYPDDPSEPITEGGAYALLDTASEWFAENSYNTTWLVTEVTPLLVLPQPKAWYCENGDTTVLADAREVARAAGFDPDNYAFDIVRFPSPGSGCDGYGYGGKAYVRGKGCWMLNNSSGTMIHELGHNYGLWHANFWTGIGDGIINQGTHVEYGNPFDVMGSAGGLGQFNAAFKNTLDWMQSAYVETVVSNGTYRIHPFDVVSLVPGQKYALKIRKDYDRSYWAEFRSKVANTWFLNGVSLNWDAWDNGVADSANGTHLLDTTPGTPAGNSSKDDSAVIIGRTYSDFAAGIHLTPIARGDASPSDNWMDVVVNLGRVSSNVPPNFTLIADRTNAPSNVAVNFSAIAEDANGDELAYAWDFGDNTFGPNSPSVSKSWTSSGEYIVRCTVSDMKGGTRTKRAMVLVNQTSTLRVAGRVTVNGLPLEGVRVHNGQSGGAYRGTYTDSDGHYTVTGLASGSHNLSAVKYGYTLSPSGWSNPLSVTASRSNLNFTAASLPTIGLSVTDTNMGEAGLNAGVIRVTRTGSTSAALPVRLNRTGTAVFGTDYTMSPAPSGTPLQWTLPAGSSTMTILLSPLADSVTEGPEKLTFTLIEDASYVVAHAAEVSLILNDDESAVRPTVTVTSANAAGANSDNIATESGGDAGVFLLARSGSVSNELIVVYSVGGNAAQGVDYERLAGVASIPAGQSNATITVYARDDANVEPNETVTVTLLGNAAYSVGSPSSATLTIVDDDPAMVTVVASDSMASETNGNRGSVVFNRLGSLAANLVVNYSLSGSASNAFDFTSLPGTITILAGNPNATLNIVPVNDSLKEGDETIIINVQPSTAYNVGNPGGAVVMIQDNEISSLSVTATDSSASEPGSNIGVFRFARTGPFTNELRASYSIRGDALTGADFQPLSGELIFAPGAASISVNVVPIDDFVLETSERIVATILPGADYSVGTPTFATVTLSDNDGGSGALPGFGFGLEESAGLESDTSVKISVRLSSDLTTDSSVNYAVTSGTASGSGVDFTLAAGTLSFPAGEVNRTLSLTVNNDSAAETDETIIITLSDPANAGLDAAVTHTYTIIDDDASGTLSITTPDPSASETGLATAVVRLSRSGSTAQPLTVPLQILGSANAPGDYHPLPNFVTLPTGSNFVDLVIVPVDDPTDETNETVIIYVLPMAGARVGSPDKVTVTISDNDDGNLIPIVRVSASDEEAGEPGPNTGEFVFTRDRATNAPLTINFTVGGSAANGNDYILLPTSVTIPEGALSTQLVVTARNDFHFETNETLMVTLTTLPEYRADPLQASARMWIVDDEVGVMVASTGVSSEDGASFGEFVLTRTGSTVANLPVNIRWGGTASTNEFSPNDTALMIPAGTDTLQVPIFALSDGLGESIETLAMTLAGDGNYTVLARNSATILLQDGDESRWNLWRAERFTPEEMAQLAISGAGADPDLDGLVNLTEYAENSEPKNPDARASFSGGFEAITSEPGETSYLVTFTRRKPPTDVKYVVEVSGDFVTWDSSSTASQELLPPIDNGDGLTETARFVIAPSLNADTPIFVRLRVALLPTP